MWRCRCRLGSSPCTATELEPAPDRPTVGLLDGQFGEAIHYGLRLQALYLEHAYRYDPLSGLSNARIEPKLHQIYVAHRVTGKLQPRMILADEVGLGKTIEAGLILKELRARGLVDRVLVVCPASLQLQWMTELESKFNEEFTVIDGDAARHLEKGGHNPYERVNNAISSTTFAAMERRREQIVSAPWDLVIFDEAHRVRRRLQGSSAVTTRAYELADELKEVVDGLLLLTATPMQLSTFELWSLIELVEPGLYPDYGDYERYRRGLPRLNALMRELQQWGARSPGERRVVVQTHQGMLRSLLGQEQVTVEDLGSEDRRAAAIDRLVDQHPLTSVLVRNRKAEVGGFMPRTARRVPVMLAGDELALYEEVADYLRDGYDRARAKENQAVGFLMVLYHKMLASSSHAIRASLARRAEKLKTQLARVQQVRRSRPDADVDELREELEQSEVLEDLEMLLLDPDALATEVAELEALVARLGRVRDSKAATLLRLVAGILGDDPAEKVIVFTQFLATQAFLQRMLEANGCHVAIFNGSMSRNSRPWIVSARIAAGLGGRSLCYAARRSCRATTCYGLPGLASIARSHAASSGEEGNRAGGVPRRCRWLSSGGAPSSGSAGHGAGRSADAHRDSGVTPTGETGIHRPKGAT